MKRNMIKFSIINSCIVAIAKQLDMIRHTCDSDDVNRLCDTVGSAVVSIETEADIMFRNGPVESPLQKEPEDWGLEPKDDSAGPIPGNTTVDKEGVFQRFIGAEDTDDTEAESAEDTGE